MSKKINAGILTNIPTPYRKVMWEYYSNIEGVEIHIYYENSTNTYREWINQNAEDVEEELLNGITLGRKKKVVPSLLKIVRKHDIWLLGGYSTLPAVSMIVLCRLLEKPYIIMFDGISPLRLDVRENIIKFYLKKRLVQGCDAFLANGKVGHEYGRKLGLRDEKIFNQYLTVNIRRFAGLKDQGNKHGEVFRTNSGIPKGCVVVSYVGRLVEHKGVQDLIRAFKGVLEENYNVWLLIAGSGDYEDELIEIAENIDNITFTGFIDYSKIHKIYLASDIFVLPTHKDPWGLVINEAMANGLPIITTNAAGAGKDLVKDNGFICPAGSIDCLKKRIFQYLEDEDLIRMHGERSREIIKGFTFEHAKKELKKVIDFVTQEQVF